MPLPKLKDELTPLDAATFKVTATTVEYQVGGYKADYTPLTAEQMSAHDQEAEELYKNSKHVSR